MPSDGAITHYCEPQAPISKTHNGCYDSSTLLRDRTSALWTPEGVVEKIAGLDVYVSAPAGGSKTMSVVFLTDIFGYGLVSVRLLADEYAKAGFYVYIPDFFQGDPIPHDFLQTITPRDSGTRSAAQAEIDGAKIGETLMPWLGRHPESICKPLIDEFIKTLREDPATGKIGVIGFCWGGKYVLLLAKEDSVDVVVTCHPSLATLADFQGFKKPTQVDVGTNDDFLTNDLVGEIKSALATHSEVPSEVNVFEGAVHGFAVRSDLETPAEKENKEAVTVKGMSWFGQYLA